MLTYVSNVIHSRGPSEVAKQQRKRNRFWAFLHHIMKLLYRRCSGFFWPSLQKICYAILSCLLRILHSTGIKLVTRHFRICITRTRPILRMILVTTIGIGITGVIESTDATQVDLGKTLRKVCTSPFLKMCRCSLFQDTDMTAHCT